MSSAAFDFIFPLWGWKNLSVLPGDGLSLSFWWPRGRAGNGGGGGQSPPMPMLGTGAQPPAQSPSAEDLTWLLKAL